MLRSVSPALLLTSDMLRASFSLSESITDTAFLASLSTMPSPSSNEDRCSSVIVAVTAPRSVNMSSSERILPSVSNTATPTCSIFLRISPLPSTENMFSISTAARSALCPLPVM